MEVKLFEVRDKATFIPCYAILMRPTSTDLLPSGPPEQQEAYLLRRSGFDFHLPMIMFGRLEGGEAQYDPFAWKGFARTMSQAHRYIAMHWAELTTGDVIDVEFILGESQFKKISERHRG